MVILVILLFWVTCFDSFVYLLLVVFCGLALALGLVLWAGLAILVVASGWARVGWFVFLVGVGYVSV